MKKLESDNESGKMKGGFFIFKNVTDNIADHEDDTKKALIYRDIEVLTANLDDATLERFKKLNNTASAVWNDGTAKNGTKVEGIASKIEGLARVVKYFQVKGAAEANSVIEVLEGKVKEGEADGFVRQVNSKDQDSYLGYMEKKVPSGKGMYIKDDELKQVGTWDKADNKKKSEAPKSKAKFASFDKASVAVIQNKDAAKDASLQQWGMAQAFIQAVKKEPSTIWGRTTNAKALYLTPGNGGGPITKKFLVANGQKYQTPLAADWFSIVRQNKRDAYDGNPTNGGYIQLLNLRKSTSDPKTIYNIELYYCCNADITNNLLTYNATDLGSTEVYMDGSAGLYQYLNGMGRLSEANSLGL